MKKNVLYISYDGLSDNLGQSQILPYIIRISENNFNYHLITCDKPQKLGKRKGHIQQLIRNYHIDWHSLQYHKSPPFFSSWYDLKKMYQKAKGIVKTNSIELIHCRSYPAMLVGYRLKRKYDLPLIFDMRGFYPEERVEGGIWKLSNPVHRLAFNNLKRRESKFLASADAIVSLTHNGKIDLLNRNLGLAESNIYVIPCAADYGHFTIMKGIEKENEMVYLGSIGTWYLLEEMLLFFKAFQSVHQGWKLRFLTTDSRAEIINKARSLDISDDLISVTPCLREDLPRELNRAKASIFFIKPSYSKTASYPTKLAESLACGLPIICNENVGDLNIFADKYPFIQAIKLNQEEFNDVASKFESWNSFSPEEIRDNTEKECGLDSAIEIYLNIYNRLINS